MKTFFGKTTENLFQTSRLIYKDATETQISAESGGNIPCYTLEELKTKAISYSRKLALLPGLTKNVREFKAKINEHINKLNNCESERQLYDLCKTLLEDVDNTEDGLGAMINKGGLKTIIAMLAAREPDYQKGDDVVNFASGKLYQKVSKIGLVKIIIENAERNISKIQDHPQWQKLLDQRGERIDREKLIKALYNRTGSVLDPGETKALINAFYTEATDARTVISGSRIKINEILQPSELST